MCTSLIHFIFRYLRLNRKWIFPLFCFPILWRIVFVFTRLDQSLYSDVLVDKETLSILLIPLFVSEILLSFGLGLTFKRKGAESWLSRLPIPDSVFISTPYFLIACFGLVIFLLAPSAWNYAIELSGFPIMFLLGVVPVASYVTVRSFKDSPYGLFFGVIAGFLALAYGELLIQFAHGNFGLVQEFTGLFEFSTLRPAIEFFCLAFIFVILLFTEKRNKFTFPVLTVGSLVLTTFGVILSLQLYQQLEGLKDFLKPLDQVVALHQKNKNQCEQFHRFVEKTLDGHPDEPIKEQRIFLQSVEALKNYPNSESNLPSLKEYYEKVHDGLAEKLVLEKTFSINGCYVISKYDLQRALIETISKNPRLVSAEQLKSVRRELWASVRSTADTVGNLIEGLTTSSILELMVDRGLVDHQFKLEILEIKGEFEKGKGKIQRASALFGFRMPSGKRIHLMFEAMKNEIGLAELMRKRLSKIAAEIEPSQI